MRLEQWRLPPGRLNVCVVGCASQKLDRTAPAKELYQSRHFRLCRAFAEGFDAWCILSAAHLVVHPDEVLAPYDQRVPAGARQIRMPGGWHYRCAHWLAHIFATYDRPVHFSVLCGGSYAAVFTRWGNHCGLLAHGGGFAFPLAGLGIGEQDSWLLQEQRLKRAHRHVAPRPVVAEPPA